MNEQDVNATIEPLKINGVQCNVSWWIDILYQRIDDLLMSEKKNYDIQFEDKEYHFYFPTTAEEKIEQDALRKEFIRRLIKVTLNEVVDGIDDGDDDDESFNPWIRIEALFGGPDPRHFQIEKSSIDDALEKIKLDDEKYGTARPLDINSYQVKMQDVTKVTFPTEEEL